MAITLINKRSRPTVVELSHPEHMQTLRYLQVVKDRHGNPAHQRKHKSIPRSITLSAKGTPGYKQSRLPDSVGDCPDVKAREAAGWIKVVRPAATVKPAFQPVPATTSAKSAPPKAKDPKATGKANKAEESKS